MTSEAFRTFMFDRFNWAGSLMASWGYLLHAGRDECGWGDGADVYPPTGRLRIRALHALDEDLFADNVYFQASEWWRPKSVTGPLHERGFTLVGYSYHCQIGDGDRDRLRYDYDPLRHPEMPSHIHPLGAPNDDRFFVTPITLDAVFLSFQQVIADKLRDGFQPRLRIADPSSVPVRRHDQSA